MEHFLVNICSTSIEMSHFEKKKMHIQCTYNILHVTLKIAILFDALKNN